MLHRKSHFNLSKKKINICLLSMLTQKVSTTNPQQIAKSFRERSLYESLKESLIKNHHNLKLLQVKKRKKVQNAHLIKSVRNFGFVFWCSCCGPIDFGRIQMMLIGQ